MARQIFCLDAEFQTFVYHHPIVENKPYITDPLRAAGFVAEQPAAQHFYIPGRDVGHIQYVYQFILSLGIIIVNPNGSFQYLFVRFPHHYNSAPHFNNPRVLEPDYTFAPSEQAALIAERAAMNTGLRFLSFEQLQAAARVHAQNMVEIYNGGYTDAEHHRAQQLLQHLFNNPASYTIINQGTTDLLALRNTFNLYGMAPMPALYHKDITPICAHYRTTVPLANAQLGTVKRWIVPETFLQYTESVLTADIIAYMASIYVGYAMVPADHNALTDSMSVYLILEGFQRREAANPAIVNVATRQRVIGGRYKKKTRRVIKKRGKKTRRY
jgi:hypothetical protein